MADNFLTRYRVARNRGRRSHGEHRQVGHRSRWHGARGIPRTTCDADPGGRRCALVFTAIRPGIVGNNLRVQLRAAATGCPAGVALDTRVPGTTLIQVTLATDAQGNRQAPLPRWLPRWPMPRLPVLVSITVGGDGSGIVALTLGSRGLSGGLMNRFRSTCRSC